MESFSLDELVAALRIALSDADAVEIAEGAYAIGEETWARMAASQGILQKRRPSFDLPR